MKSTRKWLLVIGVVVIAAVAWAAVPSIKQGWSATGGRQFIDANTGAVVLEVNPTGGDVKINDDLVTTGTVTAAKLVSSGVVQGVRTITTVTGDTTLTDAQCRNGLVLLAASTGDTTVTVTMPTLVAGYDVIFVDKDVSAGADLKIKMGTADTINGGTAAKAYVHGGGSTGVGVAHFVAPDAVDFVLVAPALEAGGIETDGSAAKWRNDNR